MLEINKIYNEDCFETLKRINDKSVDMILQDPPYNITACDWEWDIMTKIQKFWAEWKRVIKDNGAIVMTASQPFTSALVMSNVKKYKHHWIWEKEKGTGFAVAKYRPMMKTEDIIVFSYSKLNYHPIMNRRDKLLKYYFPTVKSDSNKIKNYSRGYVETWEKYPENIIKIKTSVGLHPTQKPVALFEYLIKTYTNEGDTVFDGFIGSGTTAVACINLKRNYIGCELSKKYFDIANERIKNLPIKLF